MPSLGDVSYYGSVVILCLHVILVMCCFPWILYKYKSPFIRARSFPLICYQVIGMTLVSCLLFLKLYANMNCIWVVILKVLTPDPIVAIISRCMRLSIIYESTYIFLYEEDDKTFIKRLTTKISNFFIKESKIRRRRAILCIILFQLLLSILPVVGVIVARIQFGTIGSVFGSELIFPCDSIIAKAGGAFSYILYILFAIQLIIILKNSQDAFMIKTEFKSMLIIILVFGVPSLVLSSMSENMGLQNIGWMLVMTGFLLIDVITFITPLVFAYKGKASNRNDLNRQMSYVKFDAITINSFLAEGSLKTNLMKYLQDKNNQLIIMWKFWCDINVYKTMHPLGRTGKAFIMCGRYLQLGTYYICDEYVDAPTKASINTTVKTFFDDASQGKSILGPTSKTLFDSIYTNLTVFIQRDIMSDYYESVDYVKYCESKLLENNLSL
jgi:hypothetical protein